MTVREIINEAVNRAVNETVRKLTVAGLIQITEKNTVEKTEEMLYNYPSFKNLKGREKTEQMIIRVETALAEIKKDQYYDIIEMYYFGRESCTDIADFYGVTPRTVSRNRTRLIKRLAILLYSDEAIEDFLL